MPQRNEPPPRLPYSRPDWITYRDWQLATLHWKQHCPIREAARRVGVSRETAYRALERVRHLLEDHGTDLPVDGWGLEEGDYAGG